jgi:two-component system chemotaxis sensor kinase CheA
MALDMAKYRRIFLEETTDHLAEISRALLDLEKETGNVEAIDTIFRMAHSIKSMAASLGFDSVADLSHRLEDRMEGVRAAGRVRDGEELALLFRGLETLEAMVAAVAEDREPAPADPGLLEQLTAPGDAASSPDGAAPPTPPASPAAAAGSAPDPSPDAVGGDPKKVRT